MRLGNLDGRLVIVGGPEDRLTALDVHPASRGRIGSLRHRLVD